MTNEEKIFLIEVILTDIRYNWADTLAPRMDEAYRLCGELAETDERFLRLGEVIREWDRSDGRYFRAEFPEGYEGMGSLHKLDRALKDKSPDFQLIVDDIITYPEYRFSDVPMRSIFGNDNESR
jgi:hypothetical protein